MQIRINKYISESGFCSRREADKYTSAKKGKPAGISSTTPKNSTVTKSQQAKSSPAKKERSASGSNFKSAKPAAGRKTSYNPKSKTQRRSR